MISANMRFKGFDWSHNPKKLSIKNNRKTVTVSYPYSYAETEEMFKQCCVISGEGELYGEDCVKQFNRLNGLFSEKGAGVLSIGGMPSAEAYFTKLELLCEPKENVISYAFEFVQSSSAKKAGTGVNYHIVKAEETLWDIAYIYNTAVERLLELNPSCKRPDSLSEGDRVIIC